MSLPSLSVITVCKNAVSTISRTIQSVLDQTYSNIEYIIIDGASTDGTLEKIEKYKGKLSKVISEPDSCIYEAMNKGIQLSKGDWIFFLGADDVFHFDNILEEIFTEHCIEQYDFIYGNAFYIHSGRIYDGKFDAEKLSKRNICHQAIFVKKEVFAKIGFFKLKYEICGDYEFNIRCFANSCIRTYYIDKIITDYNEKGFSSTKVDEVFYSDFCEIMLEYKLLNSKAFNYAISRYYEIKESKDYKLGRSIYTPLRKVKLFFLRFFYR